MGKDEVDESVLAANFTHDVQQILSTIKETKGRKFVDLGPGDACPEVGYYGGLGQKLQRLHCEMQAQLSPTLVMELLVGFGDMFLGLQEYTVATIMYSRASSLYSTKEAAPTMSDRQLHVRAMYASALCVVRQFNQRDPCVKCPSTLRRLGDALSSLQQALQHALALAVHRDVVADKATHATCIGHVLNGTIHIVGVCASLQTLRFDADVLPYLKYCSLALDSLLSLGTVQFLAWRTYIYLRIATGYNALALKHPEKRDALWKAALAALDLGLKRVHRLRQEEELDLPLPEATDAALKTAERDLQIAKFPIVRCTKAPSAPQLLVSVAKADVESAFSDATARARAMLHSLSVPSASSSWIYFGHWIKPTEPPSPVVIAPADVATMLRALEGLATTLSLDEHVRLLKLCVRYKHWNTFAEVYSSVHPRLSAGVAKDEVDVFHAFVLVMQDVPDEMSVTNLHGDHLSRLVVVLQAAARNDALRRDVLAEVVLALWHTCIVPSLKALDERLPGEDVPVALQELTKDVLFAMHLVAHAIDLDDVVWRAIVALRLGRLLADVGDTRRGIQVLRVGLDRITVARSACVDVQLHDEVTSTSDGRRILHGAAYGASILLDAAFLPSSTPTDGALFQMQRLNRLLASLETDMTLLLYECEYDDLLRACGRKAFAHLEARLVAECNRNDYRRGLLLLQAARRRAKGRDEQESCLADALRCFHALRDDELDVRHAPEPEAPAPSVHTKPPAPRLASRGATFVSLRLAPFTPLKKRVSYYMVFGKATGAGTDVSLNNMAFPGTGMVVDGSESLVTISGLLPNESYVFAAAAYDSNNAVIEGIGATSRPVVTLHPLVLPLCYGLLAHVAEDLGHLPIALQAAKAVYTEFVDEAPARNRWRVSPLFSHALKLDRSLDGAPRGAIAEYPMHVLHVFLRCVFVLIGPEVGEPATDGRLPCASGRRVVVEDQLHVLSTINRGMLALEVAALTGHHEYMASVSHRLYRLMVPLLHLPSSGGALFQPLCMLLESLQLVPEKHWDNALYATYMCASFELLRMATEMDELKAVHACLKLHDDRLRHLYTHVHAPFRSANVQARSLRDSIFLNSEWMAQLELSATTTISAPDVEKTKGKVTPRDDMHKASSIEEALPGLASVVKATNELRTFFLHHREYLPYVCRVVRLGIDRGEKGLESILHSAMWSCKLVLSSEAKRTLQQFDAAELVPEPPTQAPVADAPSSARGADPTMTPVETTPQDASLAAPPDVVDADVYLWSGQVFFLRGLLHVTYASPHADEATLNHLQGPEHDLSWLYLTPPSPSSSLPAAYSSPGDRPRHDGVHQLVLNMATATQLFYHAQAWPNLLEAVRAMWNGLWLAWVSPLEFQNGGYDWQPLFVCCMRCWDVLELHTFNVIHDDANVLHRSMDAVDVERPVVATSSQLAAAADATPGLDLTWLTKVTLFTLQVLCHGREWQKLVVLGKRGHVLSGGQSAISELLLPWVVYAQGQRIGIQDARVESATSDLVAFVKAFEDSQAKKKKKRSRLVVHEVISDEERAFLTARSVHEAHVRDLTAVQTILKDHGTLLQSWLDLITRSKNMCLQALDRAQKNVLRRYVLGDDAISKREILGALKACIGLCRQKRATLQLTLALMEQGDYLFAEHDVPGAIKAWTDAIDAAFGALDARLHWRTILVKATMPLNGDGAVIALVCVQLVGKLAWALSTDDLHARLECALLGSAVITTFFTGSLPHPDASTPAAFASYTAKDLVSFLPELHLKLAHPASLVLACSTLLETLLVHRQYIQVLPMACALEAMATTYLRDARGVVQAKRMKAEACIGAGYMRDACRLLSDICNKPQVVAFAPSKRLGDPDNEPVLRWLCDLSVETLLRELQAKIGSSRVAHLVLLTLLRWIVALAAHEGASAQGTALRAALNAAATTLQASVLKSSSPPSEAPPPSARKGAEPPEPAAPLVHDTEPLQLCDITKVACECDVLLATVALQDGFVEVARTALVRGMKLYRTTPKLERDDNRFFDGVASELNVLYWLDCRLLSVRCDIAQGHYDDAIALADVALDEAASAHDRVFARQLRALRIQAQLLRGDRALALADAQTWVTNDDAGLPSLTRAEVCIGLSANHRTDAIASRCVDDHIGALRKSVAVLQNAVATTDALLTHQGWMGLAHTRHRTQLLNLYLPNVPMFVVLQALVVARQLDLHRASPDDVALEHLLPAITSGLEALGHVCHPPSYLKPLLLFFKGAVLRRLASPGAVDAFLEALTLWIKDGGHPRSLMYTACMELVVVFGSRRSETDMQAAFHYLQLACKLQDQLFGLWNSSALNATSASGLGTLPSFLQQEILASAKSSATGGSAPTMEQLGYLVLPYFVSIAREHDVVFDARLSSQLHRALVSLHAFLATNHSGYAKLCLPSLPPVPRDDPEIPGGLVCVQWLQTAPDMGDMYYALGTATSAHDTRFADAPLLSRKHQVSWSAVRALKADISRLRHVLQDKEDRIGKPQAALDAVLAQIASLLQPRAQDDDVAGSNPARDHAVPHAIACSLDDVSALERVFCTSRGSNVPHPAICYFLRHVLAAPDEAPDKP